MIPGSAAARLDTIHATHRITAGKLAG